MLALGQNGHFERGQRPFRRPIRLALRLIANMRRCVLKRLKSRNEYVRQKQKTFAALVIFVKASEDAGSNELAEGGARPAHILPVGEMSLLIQEVRSVDEQTVNDGKVLEFVEFVDQRTNDGDIDSHVGELLKGEVVLDYTDDVASYAMDVGVDGEMAVRIGATAVDWVAVFAMVRVESAEERAALIFGCGQHDAPLAAGHARPS